MTFHIGHKEELVKTGIFILGQVVALAGTKILQSRDAKKVMVATTATALRIKDSLKTSTASVQESAGDILAEAKEVNRQREEEELQQEEKPSQKQ